MTAQFVALGFTRDGRLPVRLLVDADQAAQWLVDVQDYHFGLDREGMWLRARIEGGSVVEDAEDWLDFMADWRRGHPAGFEGSFCQSFEVEGADGKVKTFESACL